MANNADAIDLMNENTRLQAEVRRLKEKEDYLRGEWKKALRERDEARAEWLKRGDEILSLCNEVDRLQAKIEAALALLTRLRGWGCTCDKAFSGRGLTDPECVKCNFVADIASELEEALTGGREK